MYMRILAIETSCDETAIAVLSGNGHSLNLEKNAVYSQIDIHRQYGGVVPEVAARKHAETIIPLLDNIIGQGGLKNIDYLAVTVGPGLITSLLLGITTAKTLAYSSHLPLVAVNHMEGHIYSNWLSNKKLQKSNQYFPALILIVSGGHTELVLMKDHGDYLLIGQTLDDAVGEAYDKVAKLLALGYPGGPIVSQLAEQGNPEAYDFPRPMIDRHNFDFSLAGLKTAVLYTLQKQNKISKSDVKNICASFQQAVLDVLIAKTFSALNNFSANSLMVAGGVSANEALKNNLATRAAEYGLPFFYPEIKYTGDNAAMIAAAAYYNISDKKNILTDKQILSVEARSNWQLTQNKI